MPMQCQALAVAVKELQAENSDLKVQVSMLEDSRTALSVMVDELKREHLRLIHALEERDATIALLSQ